MPKGLRSELIHYSKKEMHEIIHNVGIWDNDASDIASILSIYPFSILKELVNAIKKISKGKKQ